MRSAMGGCVANIFETAFASNGDGRRKKKTGRGEKNWKRKKKVVQYRVFGGNVGAEREELGRSAR